VAFLLDRDVDVDASTISDVRAVTYAMQRSATAPPKAYRRGKEALAWVTNTVTLKLVLKASATLPIESNAIRPSADALGANR